MDIRRPDAYVVDPFSIFAMRQNLTAERPMAVSKSTDTSRRIDGELLELLRW